MRLTDFADGFPDLAFDHFGAVGDRRANMLTFAVNERYLREALANPHVRAVICDAGLGNSGQRNGGASLVPLARPRDVFFGLLDRAVAEFGYGVKVTGSLPPDLRVGPNTVIDAEVAIESGVTIGANCVIGAGTVIRRGARIGDGAVIGSEGMQVYRAGDRIACAAHAGGVEIGEDCRLAAQVNVTRALYADWTRIGRETTVGVASSIGHGTTVGRGASVAEHVTIPGSCRIGDGVAFGPRATLADGLAVGDGARIAAGAVVVADVPSGAEMSGHFARDLRLDRGGDAAARAEA
jgi:UDP-3-O-[3-hydroxymyristoyl] glucosamine N-acyltransferase